MSIAAQNDVFRELLGLYGGKCVITATVSSLPPEEQGKLMEKVQSFNEFNEDNDPYKEHDFGKITQNDVDYFWKIDYYDKEYQYGSPDPADPKVTNRVLTVMQASEY